MKLVFSSFVLAVLACSAAGAEQFFDIFSADFRRQIDVAMQFPDKERRSAALIKALRNGSDKEVFFVFPLLFSREVLDGARKSNVCAAELDEAYRLIRAYTKSSGPAQDAFASTHSSEIRPGTDRLIVCLHRFYEDGQLRLPDAQSNNSFKPKPLRGSA